jgi:solute carrier family 45, member 1/2/4
MTVANQRKDHLPSDGSDDAPTPALAQVSSHPPTLHHDEQTPLLRREAPAADASNNADTEDDVQRTKSVWYLILLTISIGGLQLAWAIELSNGSPYLLSLGLSKSLMALVWIAGPLTGTLVQPYVGMLSDNCRISWGKRKPFLLAGSAATIVCLLFLAWVKEIVGGIFSVFGAEPKSEGAKTTVIVVAVAAIYVLDFAINTVQASIRAIMVDCAPAHQQEAANAMASRITGVGNILAYIAGYANLPAYLWFLGNNQFKILCAMGSIGLALTVGLSAATIRERDPRLNAPSASGQPGLFRFFLTLFKSMKRLPQQIKIVCQVQLCAWIGFFPLLFYTSSYIGEIYLEPYLEKNPHMSPEELDRLYEEATRIGTFALLVNSIVSLATNVFMPFFIAPTYDITPVANGPSGGTKHRLQERKSLLDCLRIPGFTLRRAWCLSLVLFSIAMFCTLIVRSIEGATALIGISGITWAMTLWAPWAIISGEISKRDAAIRARKPRSSRSESDSLLARTGGTPQEEEEIDQAGVILGIHNMAVAAPQMVATVGSSIIFKIWQKPRGTPGDRSFSIVLALGGACVLISSFFVARMRDTVPTEVDAVGELDEEAGEQ